MFKFMNWQSKILMDAAGDGKGGGGGAPNPTPAPTDDKDKTIADLKARLEALEKAKPNPNPAPTDDPDLAEKARKEREAKETASKNEKILANAIEFNYKSKDWAKDNASLLPKSIEGIFAQAEKEVFGSALEKAQSIKVGIVSEFFAIQSNLDHLTDAQKIFVDEFKKLTKTDKQAKVDELYSSVFEPAFEYAKKLERAKQVKDGTTSPSDTLKAYSDRMIQLSRKHYLKE